MTNLISANKCFTIRDAFIPSSTSF